MIEFDFIVWDDPDDFRGNVQHIAENGVTVEEFEEILKSPKAADGVSRSSGRPMRFGSTSTGKSLAVIYELDRDGGTAVVIPITAYEVGP